MSLLSVYDLQVGALRSSPIDLPPPDVRRNLRRAAGLSQEVMAVAAGVSLSTIRRLERGNRPRPRTLSDAGAYRRVLRHIDRELHRTNRLAWAEAWGTDIGRDSHAQ